MRKVAVGVLIAALYGPACAADPATGIAWAPEDPSAMTTAVYYRVNFGGSRPMTRGLSLRLSRIGDVRPLAVLESRRAGEHWQLRFNGVELLAYDPALTQTQTPPAADDTYTPGTIGTEPTTRRPAPGRSGPQTVPMDDRYKPGTSGSRRPPETTTTTTTTSSSKRGSYLSRMTGAQWLGIGAGVVAIGVILAGSGGGDDAEPQVAASGGG